MKLSLSVSTVFSPKLFSTLRNYSGKAFFSDLLSGTIVGFVALPLALAFAIASGVPPRAGLITAIVAGFLISSLGGSRVQIGGPTGAFVVIVFDIIQKYGITGLTIATLMAGVILILMGIAGFGSVIKYVPHPVTVGFTSGIAVVIFSMQVKDFLGIRLESLSADFLSRWQEILLHLPSLDWPTTLVSLFAVAIIVLWPRVSRKLPGPLVALVATTAIVALFDIPVETIGSRFGALPSELPRPTFSIPDLQTIRHLIVPATTIALLGAIESLLSAVVADGMIGSRHRSNTELIAQGIANFVSPLFGGIPATGAIARTATNIKLGGRTPVAGMVHAVVLFLIMVLFGKYAALIPMATLAAILVVVAYNMSEWRNFMGIMRSPVSDVAVLLTTFFLTVIFDLTIAIQIGMLLAVLLFIRRVNQTAGVRVTTAEDSIAARVAGIPIRSDESDDPFSIHTRVVPKGVEVYEIEGPFFFGTAGIFQDAIREVSHPPRIQILRMRNVPAIDSTGIHMLEKIIRNSDRKGVTLLLAGVRSRPRQALSKAGVIDLLGEKNVLDNIDQALERADELLARKE